MQTAHATLTPTQRHLADNWNKASEDMWKALERWMTLPCEETYRSFKDAANSCSLAAARFSARKGERHV